MSEIIDVLALLPQDGAYFVADTSKMTVDLLRYNNIAVKMYTPGGKTYLQAGDNFTVLSAGFIFPESFCLASAPANKQQTFPAFNIALKSATSAIKYPPNFGLSGIQLPLENYETPLGVFVNAYDLDAKFRTENYNILGTLRGLDESYGFPNVFNNTSALPTNPVSGDTWTAQVTANGWTIGKDYKWSGTAWGDVTATPTVYPQVSMVGVPAAFNGKAVRVTSFIKILHTLPLV